LPVTIPQRLEDTATGGDVRRYPGVEGQVHYDEGIFVGYRHHDRYGIEPRFCFGHGLSYTTFEHADLRVAPIAEGLEVRVTITNVGARAGAEVVQVYVCPEEAADRPPQELRGFAKLFLEPGEHGDAVIRLVPRDFAHWDERAGGWTVADSAFTVAVGASSRDIRLRSVVAPPAAP
jgi:beta-glucosidase